MQEKEILEEIKDMLEKNTVTELNGDGTVCRYSIDVIPAWNEIQNIIRKHLSRENGQEITRYSRDNDGWIPVEERLPEEKEWRGYNKTAHSSYMKRLEIAYMTDTVEYTHGYYDGYKWMDERLDTIKDVVAWKIHEQYRPERSGEE